MDNNLKSITSLTDGKIYKPIFTFRPKALQRASTFFANNFSGTILYSVKANPDNYVLETLYNQGMTSFDVASLEEVNHLYYLFPSATLYFMHPVKSRYAIREAYHRYGVRNFSLDSEEELQKILEETKGKDLCLHVRLSIPNTYAELNLGEKFGVNLQSAPNLLKKVAKHAKKIGVCFHVGSQCMHPDAYRIAIRMTKEVIEKTGIVIDYFNVGGGFPSIYPGMIPPNLKEYFDAIHDEFAKISGYKSMQLLAEPGRALVAESMSLIVKVELRKNNLLYINDGTYGSLFDAGILGFIFPVQLIRSQGSNASNLMPFSFYGPTCDSLDFMKGPFYLPSDIQEGDYIEIGQLGAYGRTMATNFNGFKPQQEVVHVSDEPLMTMYDDLHISNEPLEIIAA